MLIQQIIEKKLVTSFTPHYCLVENESQHHNVPPNSETHFKVTLVSALFEGKRLLQRHRSVNAVLSDELAGPVHALALHTYTAEEWQKRQEESPISPNCLGGENP